MPLTNESTAINTNTSHEHDTIRRFSEDVHLRPFLSSHFDSENYIKGVIKDGRSEECFQQISKGIDEVNKEIKSYISLHQNDLMSGMQDIAQLSAKYSNLSATAKKIRKNVDRLKKEAFESHELIRVRTTELERIHQTNAVLRYLRQFIHSKSQLDHYFQNNQNNNTSKSSINASKETIVLNGKDFDIRNIANTAAKLINELECLSQQSILSDLSVVKSSYPFISSLSQQIREHSQERLLASISDHNQASIATCLQIFYHLNNLPNILLFCIDHSIKMTLEKTSELLDLEILVKEFSELSINQSTNHVDKQVNSIKSIAIPFPVSVSLRNRIKDLISTWSNAISEISLQIHILQRVIIKKEDPNTQKKFLDILKSNLSGHATSNSQPNYYDYLSSGRLLDLYWDRIVDQLNDITYQKVKKQPIAASRVYPSIRKAVSDIVHLIQASTVKESARDGIEISTNRSQSSSSVFGSLTYDFDDQISLGGFNLTTTVTNKSSIPLSTNTNQSDGPIDLIGLLAGFKPFRDRFLLGSLSRMNSPILQMFPEMDGYTAAIPSKRDLQLLIKAIQSELSIVIIETSGDLAIIQLISKESLKAIQLLASKVEDMIMTTPETKKISVTQPTANTSTHDSSVVNKSHAQDHNIQLISLLSNLYDMIDKLPDQLTKLVANELNNSRITIDKIQAEVRSVLSIGLDTINSLIGKQLLSLQIDSISNFILTSILLNILKDKQTLVSNDMIDSSKSINYLCNLFPEIIRTFFSSLPKSKIVDSSIQELCLRLMNYYLSVVCLIRPMNESNRLRIAKEMSMIEDLIATITVISDSNNNPVIKEFKAFRRFLFIEESISDVSKIPTVSQLQVLPYLSHLRPSTLLGYLISCSTIQCPSPFEVLGSNLSDYIDSITKISNEQSSQSNGIPSIQCLYQLPYSSIPNEITAWKFVQGTLDVYLQRITIVANGKVEVGSVSADYMKAWHDLIYNMGLHYFGKI